VYLTDVILEIFERDLSPFKVSEPVTFQKNYLLSTSSINTIHSDLIAKDFTNLKIGGIKEIEQYYKKMFEIDIKNLSVSFKEIEEIHLRRHLFVHKTGVADLEYVTKFPGMGYKLGQQIKIEHDYLIASLDRLSDFAQVLNKALLKKFPETNRKPNYNVGSKYFDKDSLNLMLEISILTEGFDIVSYLTTLTVNGRSLSDYIVQVTTLDNSCVLFLSGKQSELSVFFSPLKQHKSLLLNKTIEVMR